MKKIIIAATVLCLLLLTILPIYTTYSVLQDNENTETVVTTGYINLTFQDITTAEYSESTSDIQGFHRIWQVTPLSETYIITNSGTVLVGLYEYDTITKNKTFICNLSCDESMNLPESYICILAVQANMV